MTKVRSPLKRTDNSGSSFRRSQLYRGIPIPRFRSEVDVCLIVKVIRPCELSLNRTEINLVSPSNRVPELPSQILQPKMKLNFAGCEALLRSELDNPAAILAFANARAIEMSPIAGGVGRFSRVLNFDQVAPCVRLGTIEISKAINF